MKRILVVDDDERLCEVMRELLVQEGYDVAVAHDGNAALERLRGDGIDLLLVDINMPGLGGASLVQVLRSEPEWHRFARLPVIVMSALWDVVTFNLDIQAGFPKPVHHEDLLAKIRELIGPA